jgi:cytochrome c
MKVKFSALLLIIAISVCSALNNNASAQAQKKVAAKGTPASGKAADIAAGKGLIAKSDCLTCHKLDVKLVGPAYKDVAAKYPPTEDNYNLLIAKVMNGGSGTWGQVAMAPHPTLAAADVKKMVTYILSIK